MILYIHGFGSSGRSAKAAFLREVFAGKLIAPSLSWIPELAVDTLEQIASCIRNSGDTLTLMGSSLGGYYATWLADRFDAKAVLINPAVKPYNTLASRIGKNRSYYDFSDYEFRQKHINDLKRYDVKAPKKENFMLLLQTGDDVLDYREAAEKFAGAKIDIEEGGTHGYEGIERKIEAIRSFLER